MKRQAQSDATSPRARRMPGGKEITADDARDVGRQIAADLASEQWDNAHARITEYRRSHDQLNPLFAELEPFVIRVALALEAQDPGRAHRSVIDAMRVYDPPERPAADRRLGVATGQRARGRHANDQLARRVCDKQHRAITLAVARRVVFDSEYHDAIDQSARVCGVRAATRADARRQPQAARA